MWMNKVNFQSHSLITLEMFDHVLHFQSKSITKALEMKHVTHHHVLLMTETAGSLLISTHIKQEVKPKPRVQKEDDTFNDFTATLLWERMQLHTHCASKLQRQQPSAHSLARFLSLSESASQTQSHQMKIMKIRAALVNNEWQQTHHSAHISTVLKQQSQILNPSRFSIQHHHKKLKPQQKWFS